MFRGRFDRERSLFERARHDRELFGDIFASYHEPVLRWFARAVFDPETASDLTAETFATAFDAIGKFRGRSDEEGRAWLWAIARHQLFMFRRRGSVERRKIAELGLTVPELTAGEFERIERLVDVEQLRPLLDQALTSLAAEQREAVLMRVVGDRTYAEMASQLSISEQVARARVSRGLRKLAALMSDDTVTEMVRRP